MIEILRSLFDSLGLLPEGGDSGVLGTIGAVQLGLAVLIGAVLIAQRPSASVAVKHTGPDTTPGLIESLRESLLVPLEGLLRTDARKDAAKRLERAGLRAKVGELVMLNIAAVVLLGSLGFMLRGVLGAIVGVVLAVAIPRLYVDIRGKRRQRMFDEALPDILSSVANVVRVGNSLGVGFGTVAREYEDPVRYEINRALAESRVGGSLTTALRGVAERMESVDLLWVCDAIEINSTVGGDLVEVLESVSATIRSRARLNAQISALTAEARLSAIVLFLLPIGLATFIGLTNPGYFEGIWGTALTYWLVGAVVVMLGVGGLWIRRMIAAATL